MNVKSILLAPAAVCASAALAIGFTPAALAQAAGGQSGSSPNDVAAPRSGGDVEELVVPGGKPNVRGAQVFQQVCAVCHEHGAGHAPAVYILKLMTPASIYDALTTGAMRMQAQNLSDQDKETVAEFLAGGTIAKDSRLAPPACEGPAARFDFSQPPAFPGWGLTMANTRYVSNATAGFDRHDLGKLSLKWALGFDGAVRVRSQPALAGGALYIGSQDGRVYSLDRKTGCARWKFHAAAEVRTGIVVSPWNSVERGARPLIYFGDIVGNVYAVDAIGGALAWRDRADPHPSTTLTAAPVLYDGILYVPVSSLEEGVAGQKYDCCSFRGSIVAYQARTGTRLWQKYLLEPPKRHGIAPSGTKMLGPSGVAVWNTPAVDAKRGVLYFATGDNYSLPATELSDSIVAMDLKSGAIKWAYQATANDAWNAGCVMTDTSACPAQSGPDYDFGAATILARTTDGRELVVAGQKSGWVYALDPVLGKLAWKTKVGRGGIHAGVNFGMATRGDLLFVPISDAPDGRRYDEPARPGLYALEMHTGEVVWKAPIDESVCKDRAPSCVPGFAAPATATDDLVLAGAGDGRLRIYSADSGAVLWQYDTMQSVKTVGGGTAAGGSMGGGAGPVPYHGTLIVDSGYGFSVWTPGNLMLVFGVD